MVLINNMAHSKVLIERTNFEVSDGIINVEYYITENPEYYDYGREELTLYGIEIKKTSNESVSNLADEIPAEKSVYRNISPTKETVIDLIHILAKSQVTPVSLKYYLDDMCGIYF